MSTSSIVRSSSSINEAIEDIKTDDIIFFIFQSDLELIIRSKTISSSLDNDNEIDNDNDNDMDKDIISTMNHNQSNINNNKNNHDDLLFNHFYSISSNINSSTGMNNSTCTMITLCIIHFGIDSIKCINKYNKIKIIDDMDTVKSLLIIHRITVIPYIVKNDFSNVDSVSIISQSLTQIELLHSYHGITLSNQKMSCIDDVSVVDNAPSVILSTTILSESQLQSIFDQGITAYNDFNIPSAFNLFNQVCNMITTTISITDITTIDNNIQSTESNESNNRSSSSSCSVTRVLYEKTLFNLASLLHMFDYISVAVGYITKLLLLNPSDTTGHSFLWALSKQSSYIEIIKDSYQQLERNGDIIAQMKLSVLTGKGSYIMTGNPNYVKLIYDDMANRFESKLVDHLEYRGPWILYDVLEHFIESSSSSSSSLYQNDKDMRLLYKKGDWRVLDLGCGSGLVGRVFTSFIEGDIKLSSLDDDVADKNINLNKLSPETHEVQGRMITSTFSWNEIKQSSDGVMVGVDVSEKMVEITKRKGKYLSHFM